MIMHLIRVSCNQGTRFVDTISSPTPMERRDKKMSEPEQSPVPQQPAAEPGHQAPQSETTTPTKQHPVIAIGKRAPQWAKILIVVIVIGIIAFGGWKISTAAYRKATDPIGYINGSCSKYIDGYPDIQKMRDAENTIAEIAEDDMKTPSGELSARMEVTKTRKMFDCVAKSSDMPKTIQSNMLVTGSQGEITWGHVHASWEYIGDTLLLDMNEVK